MKGQSTVDAAWSDDYPYQVRKSSASSLSQLIDVYLQKFTALSPSSSLLAVGTTDNKVSILHFPSLELAVPTFKVDAELVDLDWGGPGGKWVREQDLLVDLRSCAHHQFSSPSRPQLPSSCIMYLSATRSRPTSNRPSIRLALTSHPSPSVPPGKIVVPARSLTSSASRQYAILLQPSTPC